MKCQEIQDRFSSLLERDLNPSEERIVREHLDSCSECQKELERFKKTLQWLHSVKEVEVPEGFLSGIYQKIEERKRKGFRAGWFSDPRKWKLPAQAVAMVTILFSVIYLTKMMSVEKSFQKDVDQPLAYYVRGEKRAREAPAAKERKEEKIPAEQKTEQPPVKDLEEPKPSLSQEKRPAKMMVAEKMAYLATTPPREIVLKISNQEEALSQLHELIKQFGGEIVKEEGNVILASLPIASFPEFEEGLGGLSPSKKADEVALQKKAPQALGVLSEVKQKEVEEKRKEPTSPRVDRGDRIIVQIRLLQE